MRSLTLPIVLASILVSSSGCQQESGAWSDSYELEVGTHAIQVQVAAANPEFAVEGLLPSPLAGPDRVSVFAGDALSLDLELLDPNANSLVAIQIPGGAVFEVDSAGGSLSWSPTTSDVGNYRLVFHAIDRSDSEQVNGIATIDLSVLPRFGLIEYGF